MSDEREQKRARLVELLRSKPYAFSAEENANYLMANGVDIALPPEPQWKPGQVVWLSVIGGAKRYLAERNEENDSWMITGESTPYTDPDHEVTDVEPVVVLTAEDVRELRGDRGIYNFTRFFAERGLDI